MERCSGVTGTTVTLNAAMAAVAIRYCVSCVTTGGCSLRCLTAVRGAKPKVRIASSSIRRWATSVVTLTEVAHRLMLLEAIRTFGLAPRTAVKHLKEHPPVVTQLTQYRIATAAIAAFNVTVVPVTPEHLSIAQQHCAQHGLLTNDALMIAVMHTLGLADVASNDPDLRRIPGLTIWQPQPQRGS